MPDSKLIHEFVDQAKNPSVGDQSWSAFFTALSDLYRKNSKLQKFIDHIRLKRLQMTNKHFSHLFFKAVQFVKIAQGDLSYKDFKDAELWEKELLKILSSRKELGTIRKILLKNHVTTTIYERYIGPSAIILKYFSNLPVEIADFGCGGNHGLRGIELNEPFSPFEDKTPLGAVSEILRGQIKLKKGIAVDRQNPDSKHIRDWRIACRFFPVELNGFEDYLKFEEKIKYSKRVRFKKSNVLELSNNLNEKFDAIIMSLVLYQLDENERESALKTAAKFLKPNGILIIQDYCIIKPNKADQLDFNVTWHTKNFSFRTFIFGKSTGHKFKEILRWYDSRCKSVVAGKDFRFLFSRNQLNASSAAFAHSTS